MAAVLGEEPAVYIRHSAVPGRLRLAVGCLYRCPERKRPLEEVILGVEGVRSASANPLTGSLLIQFDPAVCSIPLLVRAVEDASGRGDTGTRGRGDGPHPLPLPHRERGMRSEPHPRPLPHGERGEEPPSERGNRTQDSGLRTQDLGLNTQHFKSGEA
ncbi:MAG: HMA2 domain-containing protein [Chloroflexota bacterium]